MAWFLSIRFGPEYFLKINISVNRLAIYVLSHTVKKYDFRSLYSAKKCPQNVSSLFNNVT